MKHYWKFILTIGVLTSTSLFSNAQDFPNDWMGDWFGTLEIHSPKGTKATLNMELHLSKTDKTNEWNYMIVYDDGENRDERKYTLIKSDSIPGLYEVDENNGIILTEIQMGNRMFQRFEVMDNMIYGITTYEKDQIIWELISDNDKFNYQSGKGDEAVPFVTSFYPTTYQRAVLTRGIPD